MRTIYPGDEGTQVRYMQLALTRAGYQTQQNGLFTQELCDILEAFLAEKGAEPGCVADDKVWRLLKPYLQGYTTHTTAAGDSIWELAREYRTTAAAILRANPDVTPQQLRAGERLVIPYGYPVVAENVPYTYELLTDIVTGLAARYPFLETESIGSSVMGKELMCLKLGSGSRQVFYNASFHANESITTPVLLKFAEEYAEAYAADGMLYGVSATMLYETYTLYLVPMVNPDGVDLVNGALTEGSYYEQARRIAADYPQIPFPDGWKANIDGIDLNLQFPAGWETAKQVKEAQGYISPAPRDYVGTAPLEAPESAAVYELTRRSDFRLILAYHTQGEVIYWKYQDYEPERSYEIAQYFGRVSGYAVEETPGESGNAGYKDWFILTYDRPGYTIEAGMGENPLPMSQFPQIYRANIGILLGGMTQI